MTDVPTDLSDDATPPAVEPSDSEHTPEPAGAVVKADGGPTRNHMWFRVVLLYAVLGGLCPLSPLPFIDDIVIKLLHKRMVRSLFALSELRLTDPQMAALIERKSSFLLGCLTAVFLYPIKKIFRKVFYFLAVKDCVDVASELLHHGLLLQFAIDEGHITAEDLAQTDHARLLRLNKAIGRTLEQLDTRPINQLIKRTFAGSKTLAKEAGALVARQFRQNKVSRRQQQGAEDALDQIEEAQTGPIGSFIDRLDDSIWSKAGYREELQRSFLRALAEQDAQPPAP